VRRTPADPPEEDEGRDLVAGEQGVRSRQRDEDGNRRRGIGADEGLMGALDRRGRPDRQLEEREECEQDPPPSVGGTAASAP
jgi:hypothetical protein